MQDTGLITDTESADVQLLALRASDYPGWLATQSDATRNFLSHARFNAEVGNQVWLPDADPATVLVIVGTEALWSLADLPMKLPEGRYRLVTPLEGEARNQALLGWGLGSYRYTRYKAPKRAPATLVVPQGTDLPALQAQLRATFLVRDLINTPAGDMLPSHLEAAARSLADEFGAECHSITGDALLSANHPTIHAVGRASTDAPRLIELQWGSTDHPRVCLVGKGVCFDSGGLNIKPAGAMRHMKKDMGGAAHVLGLARLIMDRQLPVRLQVLVPAVENAIAGNAFRPGDIIRTRKGLSVEIDNTDAEGRLVLCDALALASETPPDILIDFATLTGAARSALGTGLPAMFCNQDTLAAALHEAGARTGDPVWRLPLHQPYMKMLDSYAADLVNASSTPYAGAITAALFLQRFVGEDIPWVHYDLMAYNLSGQPGRPEGGEAMGLRTTFDMLSQRYR